MCKDEYLEYGLDGFYIIYKFGTFLGHVLLMSREHQLPIEPHTRTLDEGILSAIVGRFGVKFVAKPP